ncbi:MAG: hypothetical protein M5U34_40065 [Chloroflexi bacterium]|nr:hypothetical protein [Chloroflexota bacterium]
MSVSETAKLVDEAALLDALKNGRLSDAAVPEFPAEPKANPLRLGRNYAHLGDGCASCQHHHWQPGGGMPPLTLLCR